MSREVNQLHAQGRGRGPRDGIGVSRLHGRPSSCLQRLSSRINEIQTWTRRNSSIGLSYEQFIHGNYRPALLRGVVYPVCAVPGQCNPNLTPASIGVATVLETPSVDCRELMIGDALEYGGVQDS